MGQTVHATYMIAPYLLPVHSKHRLQKGCGVFALIVSAVVKDLWLSRLHAFWLEDGLSLCDQNRLITTEIQLHFWLSALVQHNPFLRAQGITG